MDIRLSRRKFDRQLELALAGKIFDIAGLQQEEIEILHMVQKIKKTQPAAEPAALFRQNLKKRLVNMYDTAPDSADVPLLEDGSAALLAKPRPWSWAFAPLAALAVLAAYVSFAAASPGFYEKYVPPAVKKVLQDNQIVQTGSLKVVSDPSGATVFLNNREQNQTPTEIGGVRAGQHEVKVILAGYQEEQREIEIVPDQLTTVEVSLRALENGMGDLAGTDPAATEDRQVVLQSRSGQDSAIWVASTAGQSMDQAFTITPAADQISVTDNGIIFFSRKSGVGSMIYRVESGQEPQPVIPTPAILSQKFLISPDGTRLGYAASASGQQEVHLGNGQGDDQIVFTSKSHDWSLVGFTDTGVILAELAADGQTVKKVLAVAGAQAEPEEWILPDGTNRLISETSFSREKSRGLLVVNHDQVYLVTAEPSRNRQIFSGAAILAARSKEAVFLSDGLRIWRTGSDSDQLREIYQVPGTLNIKEFVSDPDGGMIAVCLSNNDIAVIDVNGQNVREMPGDGFRRDCLALVAPNTFSADNKIILSPETNDPRSLSLKNKLALVPADREALAVQGDQVVRVSDGDKSLEIISFADTNQPRLIGSLPRASFSSDPGVAANSRYAVVTGGWLQFIDLRQPSQPQVIKEEAVTAVGAAVTSDRAYVVAPGKLLIYNLSGNSPQRISETQIDLTQCLSVALKDNRIFIAAGDDGLLVGDISDDQTMRQLVRERGDFVRAVAPAGKFMYVFSGTPGSLGQTQVWDPAAAKEISRISPAFTRGLVYGRGDNLYGAFPMAAVWRPSDRGLVALAAQAPVENTASGSPVVSLKNFVVVSADNQLLIYQ